MWLSEALFETFSYLKVVLTVKDYQKCFIVDIFLNDKVLKRYYCQGHTKDNNKLDYWIKISSYNID